MAKKVMVVDESRIVQLQLQNILSDTDYQVIACCQNGEDALKMYDEVKPDLVTMDILMPGMDVADNSSAFGGTSTGPCFNGIFSCL